MFIYLGQCSRYFLTQFGRLFDISIFTPRNVKAQDPKLLALVNREFGEFFFGVFG